MSGWRKEETGTCHVSQTWSLHRRGEVGDGQKLIRGGGESDKVFNHIDGKKVILFSVAARPSHRPSSKSPRRQEHLSNTRGCLSVCRPLSFYNLEKAVLSQRFCRPRCQLASGNVVLFPFYSLGPVPFYVW